MAKAANQAMLKSIEELNAADRRRLTGPALRIFWNLARVWSLTEAEQMRLLNVSTSATLSRWRKGEISALRRDALERISLLIGIYRASNALFGSDLADSWIRLPNQGPLFRGETPLNRMLSGNLKLLYAIRSYLENVVP